MKKAGEKPKKKLRPNDSRHRRAMRAESTLFAVQELKNRWDSLSLVERGDWLRSLVELGCSTRGLAEELGRSATNIRRDMKIASLPQTDRDGIEAGESAKRILAQKAANKRIIDARLRIAEELRSGVYSDELATMIIEFCLGWGKPIRARIYPADYELFLPEVRNALSRIRSSLHYVAGLPVNISREKLFRRTRPPRLFKDDFWLAAHAKWLAEAISLQFPEPQLWDAGLTKAEKRAQELEPARERPALIWLAEFRRNLENAAAIHNRPPPEGARTLGRQGKRVPPPPRKPNSDQAPSPSFPQRTLARGADAIKRQGRPV